MPPKADKPEPTRIAVPDVLFGRSETANGDRRVAGDDRGGLGAQATEGDVHEVETKRETELFAGKMWALTRSTGSLTLFAGKEALTRSTVVWATASVTASKSLDGS